MNHRPWALATLLALALAPLPAAAGPAPQVEASLTYKGATIKLDHVLILRQSGEENLIDDQGPQLWIYLTDREIPLNVAEAGNALAAQANGLPAQAYARRANITGVMISTDGAGKTLSGTTYLLYAPGLADGTSVSGSHLDIFSRFSVAGGRASGAADVEDDAFTLKATFDAPVDPNPVTSDLKGAPARASAPARAMLACMHAVHMVDMDALARLNTAEHMRVLNAYRAQVGAKAFHDEMQAEPDADAVAKTVTRTIIRGANATVMMSGDSSAPLMLENGVWKCG